MADLSMQMDPCAELITSCQPPKEISASEAAANMGAQAIPRGAKTSDYYRIKNIPDRFDNPGQKNYLTGNPVFSCNLDPPNPVMIPEQPDDEWFQGYTSKPVNPMFRTSNQQYGSNQPTVHTMPTTFHARSQKFSQHLGTCGMFRNHSLNCATDKANVPDH